ncbi:MAG: hypothetical protein NHB36_13180 [Nitrospira sp.]|nr:hypothetical protein [Nitrospira sp.]
MMHQWNRRSTIRRLALAIVLLCPTHSWALEKYGRPLPSLEVSAEEERLAEESLVAGYLLTGVFAHNPSFAARPDNTGLVGMRHMLHLETDLYKQYVTLYTDHNFFSDRTNGWIELSEWDGTYALTGAAWHFNWRLQYERDAPLDRGGVTQSYADVLVTAQLQAIKDLPRWHQWFPHQNLTIYAGGGWLFHNQNYFARPDNTGRALLRYVAHTDVDLYQNRIVLYGDVNLFTDRDGGNQAKPTELDWIVGLAVRWRQSELAVYYEQDQPLDRGGLIQKYLAVQLRVSFDISKGDIDFGRSSPQAAKR